MSAVTLEWHVCRAWTPPDPFSATCGCAVAPCGYVVFGSDQGCDQHSTWAGRSIRASHWSDACPGGDAQ